VNVEGLVVDAIKPHIESGRIRAYSINSVNKYSLLNEQMPPNMKAELLTRFDRYITDEVLPLIRKDSGSDDARPLTTGASLGAFLAACNSSSESTSPAPTTSSTSPGLSAARKASGWLGVKG